MFEKILYFNIVFSRIFIALASQNGFEIYVFFELLPFKALLIVGKELQYILIFLLMLGLSPDKRSEKFLYYLLTSFLLIQAISGLYLLFNGVRGYYGVGYFTEKSPSLGMLMYFHGLVLSTFMYIRYKKNFFLFLTVILFILTFFATLCA